MYPTNDFVGNTATEAGKDKDYNDALYDMLGDISTAHSLPDRLGAFKSAFPGLTQDQIPYIYSPFYAPLKTSAILSRGTGNPTFTRATTAYVKDFEGLYKSCLSGEARFTGARRVGNLLTNTENLNGAGWIKQAGCTVTQISGAEWEVDITGCSAGTGIYKLSSTNIPGLGTCNRTISMKIVSGGATNGILLDEPTGIDGSYQKPVLSLTSSFVTYSGTGTNAATARLRGIWLVKVANGANIIRVKFPCVEDTTGQTNQNPSEYVSVGVLSAPYHGANVDGVKYFPSQNGNTVASNVVTEGQGAPIADATLQGYLSETAATQLVTPTASIRDMTDASWIAVTCTKAKNATGIDGVANAASSLTATGVNATVLQTLVAAASSRTNSAFVRRKTGTGTILLKQGTATLDITTLINSTTYTLVQLNDNELNVAFGFQISTSGDAIEVDFNQFEAEAIATSPMASAGAARNADVLTYPSAGNISGTLGSAYAEFTYPNAASAGSPRIINTGAGGISVPLYLASINTGDITIYDGTARAHKAPTYPISTPIKATSSWGGSATFVTTGGVSATAGFDGDMNVGATIDIGCINGTAGFALNGFIKNVRIWQKQLPDTILQGLTT